MLKPERPSVAKKPTSSQMATDYPRSVDPNGAKYWRLKYRHAGKEKQLALGVYPEVTLAQGKQ